MQEVEKARLQLASKAAPVSAGLHLDHHEQEHFLKGLHHHRDQQEHLLGRPKGFESHSGCPQECRRLRKGSVPWPESVVLAERNELGLLGIASLSSTVPHKIEDAIRIKKVFTQLMPYKICLKRNCHQVKYIFYDKIKDSIIICIGNTAEDRSSLFLTWANRGEFSDTSFVHINVLHMPNTQAFHIRHGRTSAIICIKCLTYGSPIRLPPTRKSACDSGYGRAGETKFRNALSCVAFVVV